MFELLTTALIVVASSALFSGSEAALLSLSTSRARQLAEAGGKAGQLLLRIREDMNPTISTIVILNNIANIVGSIVVGTIASNVLGQTWLGVFSGILTLSVIIFSEIIPKTLGVRYSEAISLFIARPVTLLTWLFTPAVWLIGRLTEVLVRSDNQTATTNEAEIKSLVRIGTEEGMIEDDESQMIEQVFTLNDLTAGDLLTPRVRMTYLLGEATLGEMRDEIVNSQHSRIIVIEESIDHVTGMVLKDDLLVALIQEKDTHPVKTFQREVPFVSESERADRLLWNFQSNRQHIAVVVDEFFGVAGVVTLEDVLEVLTGEIVDETDTVIDLQEDARRRWKQRPLLRVNKESDTRV